MSLRPGIGSGWFDQFSSDVFPSDEVICRGFPSKVPRYYDRLFEIENSEDFEAVKRDRILAARKHSEDQTDDRLAVREVVKRAQIGSLKRGFEDEI
jgi:hypothetical protein